MNASVLLAIGIVAAGASSIELNLSQSHRFDCDTPAGNLSQWDMLLPRRQVQASVSINFWKARPGTEWLSSAAVLLRNVGEKRHAGLRVVWNDEKKTYLIDLIHADGETNIEAIAEQPTSEPPFAIKITWVGGDSISIDLGDQAYDMLIDFEPRTFTLSCTSGGAVFDPVQLVL